MKSHQLLMGMIRKVEHLLKVEKAIVMNLHSLKPAEGSVKKGKRIARGQGSGRGGTSTKGHKGAQSRTGYSQVCRF